MSGAALPSSSQTATVSNGYSIGYEPKTALLPARGPRDELPWDKVSIKGLADALPDWQYNDKTRRKFSQVFVHFIRGTQAQWVISSKWVATNSGPRQVIDESAQGQAFTPLRNIRARGEAERGNGRLAYSGSAPGGPTIPGLMGPEPLSQTIGLAGPEPYGQTATGLGVQGYGQNLRPPMEGAAGKPKHFDALSSAPVMRRLAGSLEFKVTRPESVRQLATPSTLPTPGTVATVGDEL